MPDTYTKNIRPYMERELHAAMQARKCGNPAEEFRLLERAHVLGQASTYWHTKVHVLMLGWAIRNRLTSEVFGQLFRIIGAAAKTAIGLVPEGNTGGSNISPFKRMPIPLELEQIMQAARTGE